MEGSNINFFQLNCDGRKVVESSLPSEPDTVFLFQEPYLSHGRPFALRRQRFYCALNGRTAIYVPNLIASSFSEITEFIREDMVAGLLEWEGGKSIIASIYMHEENKNYLHDLDDLLRYCKKYRLGLICGADVNAWHELWFSDKDHQRSSDKQWTRGDELEDHFMSNEIAVRNDYPEVTYIARGANGTTIRSTIDLTFTRRCPVPLTEWKVNSHIMVSDHRPLTFKMACPKGQIRKSRNFHKADWGKFVNILESEMPPIKGGKWSQVRIEQELDILYHHINRALDATCPERPRRVKHESLWWNEDCEKAKNNFKSIQRKVFKRTKKSKTPPTDEEWEEIKQARRAWTKTISKARKVAWRDFTSEINSIPEAAKVIKILTTGKPPEVGLLRKPNGEMCTSSEETLNVLLEEHFPRCEVGTELPYAPSTRKVKIEQYNWITPKILKTAIQEFGPHKAAGPDGLKPIVLQHIPEMGLIRLAEIFKACITLSYTPHKWRKSIVSFMGKPNKTDKANPRTYRPLSLNSFLLKAMERVIKYHLEDDTFKKYPLHRKQYAFQKDKGTDDALSNTVNGIEQGLLRHKFVIAVFLDIQGAFDNIHPDAINRAMKDSGIPKYVRKWYYDLLTNRNCECTIGNVTIEAKLNLGIPQGAVLSPPVGWNPSMDKLVILIDPLPVEQSAFADDQALVALGDDPEMARKRAQAAIDKAVTWADAHGLRFSATKTQALFITKKTKYTMPDKLRIYGEEIDYVDHAKYLGVTIDKGLTWTKHIYDKVRSSKRTMMLAKAALDNAWGPRPMYMQWFWTSVMRPKITYGAFVWAQAAQKKTVQSKLRSIQRCGLMMIAPVRRSTPTRAMEILYNIIPLHLHIKYLALATLLRIDARVTWVTNLKTKGHIEYAARQLPEALRPGCVVDKAPFQRDWNINYSVIIGDGIIKDWDPSNADWSCFTDGSLLDNEPGAGAAIYDKDGNITNLGEKPEGGTVFQCEIHAIHMTAAWLLENNTKHCLIEFYVDSQAALRAVSAVHSNKITVNRAREVLKRLGTLNTVSLTYVRAHRKGVDKASEANEKADEAARAATTIPPAEAISAPLALAGAKNLIKAKIWADWKQEWTNYEEGRQAHYFLDGPSTKFNKIYKHSRNEIARLVQYITGHAFLRRQNRIVEYNSKDNDGIKDCRVCNTKDEETPHHIITSCPVMAWRRNDYFHTPDRLPTYFTHWRVDQMVGFLDTQELRDLEASQD